jgi:hypothetical protein
MSAASEFQGYYTFAARDLPFTKITFYCRVLLITSRFLKDNSLIDFSKHDNISKYFACLWRHFYENKNTTLDQRDYLTPIDYNVISVGGLISINNYIDTEMRSLIKANQKFKETDHGPHHGLITDISLKVRKVILDNSKHWSTAGQTRSDIKYSQQTMKIYQNLTNSLSHGMNKNEERVPL